MAYNKANNAISAAFQKIKNEIGNKNYIMIDRWTGTTGNILKHSSNSIPVTERGIVAITTANRKQTIDTQIVTLSLKDAQEWAKKIDSFNVGASHLQVKQNLAWKEIYQYDKRNVPFIARSGTKITNKILDTIPCHNCGIVLPLGSVQIDHHMPQAGDPELYTLKTLRALGLTEAQATGSKGKAVLAPDGLDELIIKTKARKSGNYKHLETPTAAAKWTTSDRGTGFLSLLAYADGLDDVMRMCKNSLLNLVPLCGHCNRVKSDKHKPIQ